MTETQKAERPRRRWVVYASAPPAEARLDARHYLGEGGFLAKLVDAVQYDEHGPAAAAARNQLAAFGWMPVLRQEPT